MLSSNIYETLCSIAAAGTEKGLFISYNRDLHDIDRQELEVSFAGDQFIWVLKQCGTYIARIGGNQFSRESTAYSLSGEDREIYHITVTGDGGIGTVKPITINKAADLLSSPGPLALTHYLDNTYKVVDISRNNEVVGECRVVKVDSLLSSYEITVVADGKRTDKVVRDIETSICDGIRKIAGSLFTKFSKFEITFTGDVAEEETRYQIPIAC